MPKILGLFLVFNSRSVERTLGGGDEGDQSQETGEGMSAGIQPREVVKTHGKSRRGESWPQMLGSPR